MWKSRPLCWFLGLQLLICVVLFRDALWGGSLLAPLDLASNLYSKYHFIDPAADGVPANHQLADQLAFDVPVQYTIYHAVRRGEIAWWDPYTSAGWPMLADAHTNGFDLPRLLMSALPTFELAYNWGHIAHFVLCGLGMFLLLRRLGFEEATCVLMAGAYECAGWLSFFFMHPYIQSAFVWYPFLWLAWDSAFHRSGVRHTLVAALWVAGSAYSGTIQTHTYLGLFALALGIGYAGRSLAAWKQWLVPVSLSGVLGLCLAAPVIFGQVELFMLSVRKLDVAKGPITWLSGLASLTGVYPWCLGTFRTLDLSKYLGEYMLGFRMFFGAIGAVLAVLGACCGAADLRRVQIRRAALALTVMYFVILSTPLLHIFYVRCAPLAGMGLIVLAAHGLETLARSGLPHRRAGWAVVGLSAALALSLNLAAWVIYPRLQPRVRELMERHDQGNKSFDSAPEMRAHQISVLPREISFQNPVALLAWLGLAGLAVWLWQPSLRRRRGASTALLLMNFVPVLLVAREYIPVHPAEYWRRMLAGGPEQQKVVANMGGTALRLWEIAPGAHDMAMPFMLPQLYRVRVLHSYTSLNPHSWGSLPVEEQQRRAPQMADRIYKSETRGLEAGEYSTNATPGLARYQWVMPNARQFRVEDLGLCKSRLIFEPGSGAELLWTDTYYPGWRAWIDGRPARLVKREPCFSVVEVPASARELVLQYRPAYLSAGLGLASGAALVLALLGVKGWRRAGN